MVCIEMFYCVYSASLFKFADEDAVKSFNETVDSMASSAFSSISMVADCNMSRRLTRRRRKVIQNVSPSE